MASGSFRACWLEKVGASVQMEVKDVPFEELASGDDYVRVKVNYSGLNYKDGMAICGIYGVVETLPLITGIDFVGVVDEAKGGFKKGDQVIMTGWEMGQKFHGGHAEYASVKAQWLVPLPENLSEIDAMTIGTAGFTAALCVKAMEDTGFNKSKPILVTGADGGVGSVAVYLLAQKGFQVAACTRFKDTEPRLKKLGATEVIGALSTDSKALDEERWGGAIDVVGGPTIPTIASQMAYGCSIASCGVAGGPAIKTTVYPFIIRGVKLYGVDSVFAPTDVRQEVWTDLAKVPTAIWQGMRTEVALVDLHQAASQILAGSIRGRVVVNVNLKTPQLTAVEKEEEDLEALKKKCLELRKSLTAKSKIVSADQAMSTILDGDCITSAGFVATMPCDALISALRKRYDKTGHPRNLEMVFPIIVGDREGRGTEPITPMVSKAIFGWTDVLEGRLPPLMATSRSLPCFAVNDLSNRTRGYIADRFLTGIRPQEFFFHCMAGREGLVDTAVKTSRSGYLQRCLVKHMESLKVSYDHTVRDSDGSILQFLYGEDGADVTRATYLYKFEELWSNFHFLEKPAQTCFKLCKGKQTLDAKCAPLYLKAKQEAKAGELAGALQTLDELRQNSDNMESSAAETVRRIRSQVSKAKKKGIMPSSWDDVFEPVASLLGPAHYFGSTSEVHEEALQAFMAKQLKSGQMNSKQAMRFEKAMRLKFQKTLAEPGEAVGVIAAQSMGEPSTQMTLNTFHLAGHGGANVTLGIPRLREIIQTASRSCSTPLMTVPIISTDKDGKLAPQQQRMAAAQSLKRRFRKVTLMDCIARMVVNESVRLDSGSPVWIYHCHIEFMPLDELSKAVPYITKDRLSSFLIDHVCKNLKKELLKLIQQSKDKAIKASKRRQNDDGGKAEEEPTGGDAEEKAKAKKKRKILGAEDKAEMEEVEVNLEEEDAVDESEKSGMYSTDEEAEPETGTTKAAMEDEEDEKDKDKTDGDTGGTKGEEDSDDVDAGSGGKRARHTKTAKEDTLTKGSKTATQPVESPPKKKGGTAKLRQQAEADLKEALESGGLLWNSPFRGNQLSMIVTHRHSQCPHSLFVGEVLRQILETAELQDPACLGVQEVHVKVEQQEVSLECEGINLFGLQALPENLVNHRKIYTNDIRKILELYGVEAARASVVKEVRNVFGHYGIQVNHRHLSLIADYMAHGGDLRAFNRMGMQSCASPLLQMSYETTVQFLSTACQEGLLDNMVSPASAIVLGKPPEVGTGIVHLMVDLDPPEPEWKKRKTFEF